MNINVILKLSTLHAVEICGEVTSLLLTQTFSRVHTNHLILSFSHFLSIETVYIEHDILLLYQTVQTSHHSNPGEGDHGPGPEGRVPAGGC